MSPGIPTRQHKVVVGSRGGIAPETPLRVGGLSPLILRDLCRLCASSPPRKRL